jgi:hypothetical protein
VIDLLALVILVSSLVAVAIATRALLLADRTRRRRVALAGVLLAVLGGLTLPFDDLAAVGLALWYSSAIIGVFLAGRARRASARAPTAPDTRLRAEKLFAIVLVATGAGALIAVTLGADPPVAALLGVGTFIALSSYVPEPHRWTASYDRWELLGALGVVAAVGLLVPWPPDFAGGALLIAFGLGSGIGAPLARRLRDRSRQTPSRG